MKIVSYDDSCRNEWDRFVESRPDGTLFHLTAWKRVVEKTYGWESEYRMIRNDDDTLAGIVPFFKTDIFGMRGVYHSLPYALYGGPLLPDGMDEYELWRQLGWEDRVIAVRRLTGGFDPEVPTATLMLNLPGEAETLWGNFKPKVRNQVRKAEKHQVLFGDGRGDFDACYRVYAENMKRLGTPAHGKVFFRTLLDEFDGLCRLQSIRKDGAVIGTMLLIGYGSTWCDYMASTLQKYNYCCANMGLYWGALQAAIGAGCSAFDFGRSTVGTGTFGFKKQWGAQPVTLDYYTVKNGVKAAAGVPRPGPVTRLWSYLPQAAADTLGPRVRKYLL